MSTALVTGLLANTTHHSRKNKIYGTGLLIMLLCYATKTPAHRIEVTSTARWCGVPLIPSESYPLVRT